MKASTQILAVAACSSVVVADWRDRADYITYYNIKATHNPLLDQIGRKTDDLACWKKPESEKDDGLFGHGWESQGKIMPYIIALDSIDGAESEDCLRCFDVQYYGRKERGAPFLAVDKMTANDWGIEMEWEGIKWITSGDVKEGESFNVSIALTNLGSCTAGREPNNSSEHAEL